VRTRHRREDTVMRTKHRREDTVKISLKASGNESVNWIHLDQERNGDRLL
jgi:hypothetical protein